MYKNSIRNKFGASFLTAILLLTAMTTIFAFSAPAVSNGCDLPVADANGPYEGYTSETITLDGSGSTAPRSSIVLYEWDFDGDGTYDWSSSSTGITTHVYTNYGTYTAELQVTNGCGETDTDTAIVKIYQENPGLDESCGIDIALVLDSSGSITGSNLAIMKTAFIGFVDALMPSTPTQMSVTDFDDTATVLQTFTSDIDDIKAAINTPTSDGCTNWEDALIKAHSTFDPRVDKPDLVIFASDGNPNTIVGGSACEYSDGDPIPVGAAVAAANAIKADGIRIITLGIGESIDAANLMAISSSDAYYEVDDFDELEDVLYNISSELCGGTVTVRKYVDGQPAEGWEFTATVTDGTPTPSSGYTDVDGYIVFDIEIDEGVDEAMVNITETLEPGFTFENAVAYGCDGEVGTPGYLTITDIPVGTECAIYAVFNNSERTDDTPPIQTFEVGNPNITRTWLGNEYYVIGPCTPIWINSTDDESGSDRIEYSVWLANDLNQSPITWTELPQYHRIVYDEDDGDEDGVVHAEFYLNETCLHEIRYQCWDKEGNTEGVFSTDLFVDKCTPVVVKEVGIPQYGVGVIQPPWANLQTPLTFTTYDRCCLPGGTGVKSITILVWWKENTCDDSGALNIIETIYVEDGDANDTDPREGFVGYEFHFKQSGWYELEYWAEDIMCNIGGHVKQQHRVDTDPPEITKTHPDHGYLRINDTYGYLKCDVPIILEAEDMPDDTCNVSLAGMFWRYEFNGTSYPLPGEGDAVNGADIALQYNFSDPEIENYWWYNYTDDIRFFEECQHDLYYFAIDNIGNYEAHHQVYYVDDTEPYVEVEYPDHGYYEDAVDHLKIDTPITLAAYDNPDNLCQADIESIFYRYEWNSLMFPSGPGTGVVDGADLVGLYGEDYNIPEITDYYWYRVDDNTVDISFLEECQHDLIFFAKDNVCHRSELYYLTFYVDGQAPELDIMYPEHGYYADDDEHLKCNTTIILKANDLPENDCAAGIESIFWRYEYEGDPFPDEPGEGIIHGDELVTLYGDDYDIADITDYFWYRVNKSSTDIWFEEECYHELFWFAKDNVCQRTEIWYSEYYVDDTGPWAEIEFSEEHGYYQDDDDRDHIKGGMEFSINAYDLPENECMAGIESIFYRYEWNLTMFPSGPGTGIVNGADLVGLYGENYNIPEITDYYWYRVDNNTVDILFLEECQHDLFFFAKDNVCHRSEIYNHTIYVDCTEPEVWLELPGHGYYPINETSGYIREETQFTIKAEDFPENDCAVGIESIFYRYEWNDVEYPSGPGIDVISGDQLGILYGYTDPAILGYWWYYTNSDNISIDFGDQCQHDFYYWAKDNVCQRTDIYEHTFYVDDMAPMVDDYTPTVTHGVYVDESDIYLKLGLPIYISAMDLPIDSECDSGIESIFWRYEWDDQMFPVEGEEDAINGTALVDLYGDSYDIPEITDYWWYLVDDILVEIIFAEECEHTIYYFAKDNVCHRTDVYDNTYYIDGSGPEIDITHPDHGYIEIDEASGYLKAGISVNLEAFDKPDNDCAAGIESIFWRYEFNLSYYPDDYNGNVVHGQDLVALYGEDYNISDITDYYWYRVDDNTVDISFLEECQHDLFFFAKDNVCNRGIIYHHTYFVDEFAPEFTKEHPSEGYAYIDEKHYITCGAPIWINATDDGECDAGVESIFWRYEFNLSYYPDDYNGNVVHGQDLVALYGEDYNISDITDYYWYRVNDSKLVVSFYEDCIHDLYYFGKDNVCHPTDIYYQTYYVDCTPPETTKDVEGPTCIADEDDIEEFDLEGDEISFFWIRDNDTLIILDSEDYEEPCASGIDYMHIELWWDENNDTIFDEDELLWEQDINGSYYEFKIYEDCLHKIVWYSVDLLGNAEDPHVQYHRVDSTPPESVKTFNGPTYPAEDYPNEMYGPDLGEHYWVTSDTEVNLTAVDHTWPCASGVVGFHVKVEWDPDCDGVFDIQLLDEDIPSLPYSVIFTFKELVDDYYGYEVDCYEGEYKITWSSYDCLYNTEEEKVQYHRVDDTGPHVIILKPTDGFYSDGSSIPSIILSEDLPNIHCGAWDCGVVGIEDGKQGYAWLIDVFPDFNIVELDTTNLLYDEESHEYIGNAVIPNPSGIPDGAVLFVAGSEDNLGNSWNSLFEILHAYFIQAMAECGEGNKDCCMDFFADLIADFIADQNIVWIGIDNTPPEVEITYSHLEVGTIDLEVDATDVFSGIEAGTPCYVTIGGVTIGTLPYDLDIGGCAGTLSTAGVPDGEQTLTVSVHDRAGCRGSDSVQVFVPNLPGPTTSGTDVTPASSEVGTELTVTATTFSTIALIADADFYVIDYWGATVLTGNLDPVDGDFDETSEDIITYIDTTGWDAGYYTIYVRGQDDFGRWGAYDEEEFTLVDPAAYRPVVCKIIDPEDLDEFEVTCGQKYVEVVIDAYRDQYNGLPKDHEVTVKLYVTEKNEGTIATYYPTWNGEYFTVDIDIYKYQSNAASAELLLQAYAVDEYYNSKESNPVDIFVDTTVKYSVMLKAGWNGPDKVNLAVYGCDDTITSVLASIDPYYDFVFEVGTWDNFWYNQVDEGLNGGTLQTIDRDGQYWIHMMEPARFYIDENCPEVSIDYPSDEQVFHAECLEEDIWGYACDIETSVVEVVLTIYDDDAGLYWDGAAWVAEETQLTCVYDDETKEWYYDGTADIDYTYISGHTIILTATATDMAGCSCSDTIWYMFIDDSDPYVEITYPVNEATYDDCLEPSEIYGIAYDDECETIVTEVYIQIQDEETGKWWDGDSWEYTSTDLLCTYDSMLEEWSYDGDLPEWEDQHEYTVYARATDAAGNTGEDEIVFYYICEEPETYDFGDAPDPTYPTLLASDGARHLPFAPYMGVGSDLELDGQPTVNADGDDLNGDFPDDEDGVIFYTLYAGGTGMVDIDMIQTPVPGYLNAWIDFNQDDDWDDTGEQIFTDEYLTNGIIHYGLTFSIPPEAVLGDTYARFRINSLGGLTYTGAADDGEVEDYKITLEELPCGDPTWTVTKETWCYSSEIWWSYGYAENPTNTAQFRITFQNTGQCAITDPEIIDQLPLDFVYNSDSITVPAGVTLDTFEEDTSTNYLYWNFTGVLQPGEQIEIVFWADYIGDSTPNAYYTNWALGGPAGMMKIIHDSGVYVNWWIT